MRATVILLCACTTQPRHATSHELVIDRFGRAAGHLMVRDTNPALPAPGAPIDLDRPPFVTRGLGPDGKPVRYYNFDVQSRVPALRYRIVQPGTHDPVAGQPDIVDRIPGDAGYSDFWRIAWVELPPGAAPGSITNAAQLGNQRVELSAIALDCPIVPAGSAGHEPHGPRAELVWYRGTAVTCLRFDPELTLDGEQVPTSPIYVTFASELGPPSGFRTETASPQTHNVVMSVPGDVDYSPLWDVHVYARTAFDTVHDASSAVAAPLAAHGPLVNCPIVSF